MQSLRLPRSLPRPLCPRPLSITSGAAIASTASSATATVVYTAVVGENVNTGTELPHRTLQSRHLRGALPGISTQRVLVSLHISPDMEHSMALSGVHLIFVRGVINEYPVASDMTVYNVRLHAVNGVLFRSVLRSKGG